VQLGFGKLHRLKHSARILEDAEAVVPKRLCYRPPLILSFRSSLPLDESAMGRFGGCEAGAFEVKASGDSVKAYGLLWLRNPDLSGIDAIAHRQICPILRKLMHLRSEFGRVVIGGGFLMADYDARVLRVFGRSGDYGMLPDFMLHEVFRRSGLRVHVAGYGNDTARLGSSNSVSARDWYLSKGIEVEG
jgi:hypothetical protein